MAISIISIKRTGTITQDPTGLEEMIGLEFTVTVSQKTVTQAELAAVTTAAWVWGGANPLPKPFVTTLWGSTGLLTCKSCKLTRREDDPVHWKYAVTFDNKQQSAQDQAQQEEPNPILRPPVVNRSAQMVSVPVERDLDDKPLLNTAMQRPVEPLMLESPHETLTVESYQPAWPLFYQTLQTTRTINSTDVTIRGQTFAAKTLWFWPGGIDDGRWENGIFYFTVRFEFVIRPGTWTKSVERLSAGYEHLIVPDPGTPSIKKLVKIKLTNGEEALSPMMLDGAGHCNFPQDPEDALYQTTNIFTEVDFNTAFAGGKLPGID